MHYLLFIVTSLIWGSGFFLMKIAGFAFGPISIAASSTLGGAVVLWAFWFIRREAWHLKWRHVIPLIAVSLIGYLFPYSAGPFLVKSVGHGFVGTAISLVPLLTILVSIPLLGVYPSKRQLSGVMVGMACLGLIVMDGMARNAKPIFLLVAVSMPLCYAFSNTMVQRYFSDLPPIILAAMFMSVASALLTPIALTLEPVVVDQHFTMAIVAVLLMSVFARGFAMLFFYRMIQDKGPLFAGMVTYVIPTTALIWSWFDNERVTWMQVTAIVVVLIMVVIVQRDIVNRSSG